MLKKTHKGMLSHFAGSSKHERKYSDKQIKDMRDRVLAGESCRAIGKTYSVSGASIYNTIKRHNPIITTNKKLPENYVHISIFCEVHNINYNTVVYHIRKKKLPKVKHNNKIYLHIDTEISNDKFISDTKIENIQELRDKGFNITQISKQLKVNRKTVRYYINSTCGRS